MRTAFTDLEKAKGQEEILKLFGAKKFIPTKAENYDELERIAGELNLLKP